MSGFQQILFLAVLIMGMSSSSNGQISDLKLSDDGTQAYKRLVAVDTFAMGGTGYAGTKSSGELALRQLMKETDAEEALLQLIGEGSPEGGLYALVGLRSFDRAKFDVGIKRYLDKPEPGERDLNGWEIPEAFVVVMSGCLRFTEKRADVVEKIRSGNFDVFLKNASKDS